MDFSQELIPYSPGTPPAPHPPLHSLHSTPTFVNVPTLPGSWAALLHLCVHWSPKQKKHLSDSSNPTLNDFHLAWPIQALSSHIVASGRVGGGEGERKGGLGAKTKCGGGAAETRLWRQHREPLVTRNSPFFSRASLAGSEGDDKISQGKWVLTKVYLVFVFFFLHSLHFQVHDNQKYSVNRELCEPAALRNKWNCEDLKKKKKVAFVWEESLRDACWGCGDQTCWTLLIFGSS